MTDATYVHILRHGYPLCRFSFALPKDWPEGHQWVGVEDAEQATCQGCKNEVVAFQTVQKLGRGFT